MIPVDESGADVDDIRRVADPSTDFGFKASSKFDRLMSSSGDAAATDVTCVF